MMYIGIGIAVVPHQVPAWFTGQRIVGSVVIAGGAALVVSALIYFRSWRFRAAVDIHHQLATGGPFRLLRHPIYMGLNLLALGSAIWVPTPVVWAAFVLMAIGSDLRARAEEALLIRVFGSTYREYTARTRRFVPGIY
jgi:protein-S-isoprenylcysteine O-methyltransferase Ste14